MASRRAQILAMARASGKISDADVARAEARRTEYFPFGADVPIEEFLAEYGLLSADELEEANRGEDIPSRLLGLDVVRLAGGTPERPVLLVRRALDGECFLVHACMQRRADAPADVDAFVKAAERARRLTGPLWLPVREASLVDGAYAAATAVPEGVRLDERIAERGPLAPDEAVSLVRRLAEALWPLEALGAPASFPDPSLVYLAPDGRPTLVSIEVLLAASGTAGNLPEVARSAARCLARLVGPERVSDPSLRDLMADLSSGRFDAIRPTKANPPAGSRTPITIAEISMSPADGPRVRPSRLPAPAPVAVPAARRLPVAWIAVGVVAVLGVGYAVVGRGHSTSPNGRTEAREPASSPDGGPRPPDTNGPRPHPVIGRDPALVALDEALEFLAAHRDDAPQAVVDRFRSVEARYGGSEAAIQASARRQQFEKDVEEEAGRKAEAIVSDVERFLAADEMGAARSAADAFPAGLAFTKAAGRIEALRGRVKQKAEAVYATLRTAIDAGSEPGHEAAARAAFDRVKALGDRDLSARAEARLAAALGRSASAKSRRGELEPEIRRVVGESLAAAGLGDFERAKRALDGAEKGPLAEPFRDRLTSARDAVGRITRVYDLAAGAARALARAGKAATLAPREYGAKPFQATIVEVAGDRISFTKGGVAGSLRLPGVDADALATLALSDGRDTDPAAVLAVATFQSACGLFALAEASLARAQALGASAAGFDDDAAATRAWLSVAASRELAAGDVLLERDAAAARQAFAHAALTAPFLPDPHRRLGEMGLAERKLDAALVELSRAKALGGAGPDLLHAIARASAGRPDAEVLEAWRAFLAAAPTGDPRVEAARAEADRVAQIVVRGSTSERLRAAKALLDAGKAADAVAAIEEAAAADPASVDARRALGRAAEKAGDVVKAYLSWRSARDLSKATKDATEAKEQMDRLERTQGERPAEAYVRKGAEEEAAKGDVSGAVEGFRRAVAMAPLDIDARIGLGGSLLGLALRTGSKPLFEEGVLAYGTVVELAPDDPRGWAGRAELRRWKGDYAGAIDDATKAIAKRRDFFQAYNTRCLAEYQSLEFDAALADVSVVTTLAPLLATPRITRAGIYAALGRYDEAEADLAAAGEREPTDAEQQQIGDLRKQIAVRRKAGGR